MAVKIKLKRLGKVRNPQYRIVVADARTRRDGRAIEEIGIYHPKEEPSLIRLDSERVQYWLSVGAQPTEAVAAILRVTGDWQTFKGLDGAEGTLRTKEPRRDKTEVFNEALASEHGKGLAPKGSSSSAQQASGKDAGDKQASGKDAAEKQASGKDAGDKPAAEPTADTSAEQASASAEADSSTDAASEKTAG